MSRKYKFYNKSGLYFVSFATVYWLDVFTRQVYFNILVDSVNHCRADGLNVQVNAQLNRGSFMVDGRLLSTMTSSARMNYNFRLLLTGGGNTGKTFSNTPDND